MILSLSVDMDTMTKNAAMSPEILYFFDTVPHPDPRDPTRRKARPSRVHPSLMTRIRNAIFSGLAKICLLAVTLSAPLAATVEETIPKAPAPEVTAPASGADTLKAQLNALQGSLQNLQRLRRFLDDAGMSEKSILTRAQHLIETMPAHEDAGAAAWRIAAIASLTVEAGALANVNLDIEFRLPRGAIGWDFGPESSKIHTGFTPVTPSVLDNEGLATGGEGSTPLSDGITAVTKFHGSLPNGLYRVLIVRDAGDGSTLDETPFGGDITVNGSPVIRRGASNRDRLRLTGDGGRLASTDDMPLRGNDAGLGVHTWAIVENGELQIDFGTLPEGRMITAVIAEPFDIDKIDLQPAVLERLAEALGSIAPAAGPEHQASRRVSRSASGSVRKPLFQAAGTPAKATSPRNAARPILQGTSGNGFAASRRFGASSTTPTLAATGSAPEASQPPALTMTFADDDTSAFEARQILVKRSVREGEDSEGFAVDLESLLDDASLSGTFLCASVPCDEVLPNAPEPDLVAAALLLGDWLEEPESLAEDWTSLQAVLDGRELGDEVAVVYLFDVDGAAWTNVELRASAGSGIFIWLDGDYIFGAMANGPFIDDLEFEYSIELPDLSSRAHFLQILSESHVDAQGLALELRGTPLNDATVATATIIEPSSILLFGIGLLSLGISGRRRFS